MIPYATCMRFGSRRRRQQDWLVCKTPQGPRGSTVVLERDDDGIVHVKVVECNEDEESTARSLLKKPASLSASEYNLLEALDIGIDRPLTTTPFLTLFRRRDNQPVLQPWKHLMNILDDSYHGVSECLLGQVDRWAFNTFALDVCSGGRSMPRLLVHLFHQYGFISAFKLDVVKVWHCFNLIDAGYHSNNPYHNSVHAADVTQAMHCFLLEEKIREHMTPVEAMASLIAAVTHDLDHPGVNQPFLIATSNHLAALYKNFSVLENHHWRSAISCLRQSGIFDHLDSSVWDEMEEHIRSLILATDITRQQEFLSRFKRYLENSVLNMAEKEYRHFILQIALKCADLGNPCRPWDISHRWSLQVCKEFYRQGDYEKRLNIPVTPICDRDKTTVAKIQADFFKYVVSPLFEIWHQFLNTPLSNELLDNLRTNHVQWEKIIANDEIVSGSFETDLNAPLASEEEEGDLEDEEVLPPLLQRNSHEYSWMEESLTPGHWGRRRHSMPLSLPKMLPRTVIRRRRQSLPVAALSATKTVEEELQLPPSPRLSTEDLQPTSSLLSLSSTSRGAPVRAVLQRGTRESERRLVHQPVSYPPYRRRTSEPYVQDRPKVCPRRSESVYTFSTAGMGLFPGRDEETDRSVSRTESSVEEATETEGRGSGGDGGATHGCETGSESGGGEAGGACADGDGPGRGTGTGDAPPRGDAPADGGDTDGKCENGCGTPPPTCEASLVRQSGQQDTSAAPVAPPQDYSGAEQAVPVSVLASNVGTLLLQSMAGSDMGTTLTVKNRLNVLQSASQLAGSRTLNLGKAKTSAKSSEISEAQTTLPSWSHHVSQLAERLQQPEFDHPPGFSWKGCARLTNRRSSAPTALSGGSQLSSLAEAKAEGYHRRSSVPFEHQGEPFPLRLGSTLSCRPAARESNRRHSIGFLEPFQAVPSSESDETDAPTSSGTASSTRRSSCVPHRLSVGSRDSELETQDLFLPFFQSSPLRRRRGSLPADVPLPLMVTSGTESSQMTRSEPDGVEPTKRRGSTGEILSALIGPYGALQVRMDIVQQVPFVVPASTFPSRCLPRRGSAGGLELLSGFWRSRTDWSPGSSVLPPQSIAGRFRLQRQANSLDSTGIQPVSVSSCSSAAGSVLCSQRRGSFPLDFPVFSFRSGELFCCSNSGD